MNTARSIEEQILHSGIFKLNDKDEVQLPPKGIFKLTSKKDLSKRATNYISYKSHVMRNMVTDLAIEIKDYLRGPRTYNSLESVANDFENEFVEFLKSWDFSPEDLEPYCKKLVNKAKKRLKKHITPYDKKMSRWGMKESLRLVALVGSL